MRILFVCTGNSCRSPMAELYFNAGLEKRGIDTVSACSAGLNAVTGCPPSAQALQVLAGLGIDGKDFRSRQLTEYLLNESDIIIAMTGNHAALIRRFFPECKEKLSLLLGDKDVPDPFGGPVEAYAKVFETMRPALDSLAEKFSKK